MTGAAPRCAWLLLLGGFLVNPSLKAQQPTDTLDQPIDLGSGGSDLGEVDRSPLQLTGFGVAGYNRVGRTGDNSFAAGKMAIAAFREITDHGYVFGQLTTAVEEDPAGGEPVTETEIDNLLVSVIPPGASNLSLTLGKVDLPIGFERDDEPLLFLASPSFNFELGRPVKMVGLSGTWSPTPKAEVSAFVFNGWDTDLDPNQGKSGGVRLGFLPTERLSLGVSGLYGKEGDPGATNDRYLINLDYAWQPTWNWVVAGEANYGGDHDVLASGRDATWGGAMLTIFHQFTRHWGFAARAEVFKDADGVRTGVTQTLESYSLAPLWSLGVGREGIFANLPHTRIRIPRLQARAEVRVNHSNTAFFDTDSGPDTWNIEYRFQLVTTF